MRHFSDVSENRHSPSRLSIGLLWTFQKDIIRYGVVRSFNTGQIRALQVVVDKLSTGCFSVDKWCFQTCQVFYLVRLILTLSENYSSRMRLFMAWMIQRKIITKIFWTLKKPSPNLCTSSGGWLRPSNPTAIRTLCNSRKVKEKRTPITC